MKTNQRVVIFAVIVVFMVSVFGSAIFILADQDSQENQLEASQALQEQADEFAEAQRQQQQIDQQAAACGPLPLSAGDNAPRELPEYSLPTGEVTELEIIDLTEGTGAEAQAGDCVVAYYHGTLTDGTVFDSAFERGTPNRFSLLRVIEGWQLGVPGMKEGGVRVLNIPSAQAYGEAGSPPLIAPNTDLTFVVELVEVVEI